MNGLAVRLLLHPVTYRCCFAPILWRLPSIGIKLPVNRHLKPLIDYQKEVFKRPGFLDSLSSLERDLKED